MTIAAVFITMMIQFGVIALASAWWGWFILTQSPLTTDFSRVYGPTSAWLMLMIAGLAAYGFYASRGGAPLLGRGIQT